MERAAEQVEEFRRDEIQSSSTSGHQISRKRAGNQNSKPVLLLADLNSCLYPKFCGLSFNSQPPCQVFDLALEGFTPKLNKLLTW